MENLFDSGSQSWSERFSVPIDFWVGFFIFLLGWGEIFLTIPLGVCFLHIYVSVCVRMWSTSRGVLCFAREYFYAK